jgi:hypothetical protein
MSARTHVLKNNQVKTNHTKPYQNTVQTTRTRAQSGGGVPRAHTPRRERAAARETREQRRGINRVSRHRVGGRPRDAGARRRRHRRGGERDEGEALAVVVERGGGEHLRVRAECD